MATSASAELNKLVDKLTAVIIFNDDNILAKLSLLNKFPSKTWCRKWNSDGNTLLQTSIIYNSKQAFDYLLPIHDVDSLETRDCKRETALSIAIKMIRYQEEDYFALQLIKSGACIKVDLNNLVITSEFFKILIIMLEKGINMNAQNYEGNTVLHTILMSEDKKLNFDEAVAALMYYNADPHVENHRGYIPFEYAVKYDHKLHLQEILFLYTFDEYTDCQINVETVIHLAESKSPLFYEIFEYNITFKYIDRSFMHPQLKSFIENCSCLYCLLDMDRDSLEIIVRNCTAALEKLISLEVPDFSFRHELVDEQITSKRGINNLNILLENETKASVISLLTRLTSNDVFISAIGNNSEEDATEILTYLLSYGLNFGELEYDVVYRSFGYSNLFKLMLHIGTEKPCDTVSIIPRVFYNIFLDLETIFKNEPSRENSIQLLHYFAHPKLADYLMEAEGEERFSEETRARIRRHPKVPRLEEFARNVFRKYLIDKFQINNTSSFYTRVNWLPVSGVYKKIITYETKLYHVVL